MTAIGSLCRWQAVELRGALIAAPVIRTMAWRFGDWAAHEIPGMPGCWCLTLLPLGLCLPTDWASFTSGGAAVGAMRAIARIRNDWHRVTQPDLTKALRAQLQDICRRHGACAGPVGFAKAADRDLFGIAAARLNGYAAMPA